MASITQIEQKVDALAVRIANEIDTLRAEIGVSSGATPEWANIIGVPSTFTPADHTQASSTITDFAAAVDARIALAGGGDTPDWTSITGKPTEFAPSAHTQASSTITDFAAAVDARIALAGAGDGNVVGPVSAVDGELVLFNGTTGAVIKSAGAGISANGLSLVGMTYANMKAALDLEIGTDVQAYSTKLGTLAGQTWAADKITYQTSTSALATTDLTTFGRSLIAAGDAPSVRATLDLVESFIIAVSDETTALTTGTAKVTFRAPYALTLNPTSAPLPKANVNTVSSSGVVTVDINKNGASILSTKLTIDATEKTSATAATPAVFSSTSMAADDEVTIDIDTAGTGAKGLKVILYGVRQ